MNTIPQDVLRDILLWVPFCDIFTLSVTSYVQNQQVTQALNAYTSQGRQWWEDKVARDFPGDHDLGDMPPNDQYMFLFAFPTAKLYYAVMENRPSILRIIQLTTSESRARHPRYDYLPVEDLAYVLSLASIPDREFSPLLAEKVWKMLDLDQIFPILEMIQIGRFDANLRYVALRLLQYPRVTANQLFVSAYQVIRVYVKDPYPVTLEVLRKILQHPKYVISTDNYYTLTEAIRSNLPKVVSVVLDEMREEEYIGRTQSGDAYIDDRKVGVDTVKGYPLYTAAERGQEEIVSLLLAAGANPSVGDNHPFRNAFWGKHVGVMRLLSASHYFQPVMIKSAYLARMPRDVKALITQLKSEGKVMLDA